MISLSAAGWIIVQLAIAGIVFGILHWVLESLPPPEPLNKVARAILILAIAAVAIGILLQPFLGRPLFVP